MRYRLSTLLLLVLCIALGVAWRLASYSNADKNHLSNIWYDQTGSVIVLTFDTDGLFTKKEYDPSSGLQYTQYGGKYEIQNDSTVVMTIESSRDYSWNGGDDWALDHEETELNFDTTFKFAINGTTLVLTKTGGSMVGPHGGAFKLDGE